MRKVILLCGTFLSIISASAQDVYYLDTFLDQIAKYHPIGKQADLRIDQSKADYFAAKGIYDPTATFEKSIKTLDNINYYDYTSPELKFFTPFGLTLKTGLEQSNGKFINNEKSTGTLSYLGIELPLLKGLLIDNQRAMLQQSKIFIDLTQIEKRNVLNEIYISAIESYWQWNNSYQLVNLINQNLENAKERFRLLKIAYVNGDKAVIDTLESFVQVQNFELIKNEAILDFQNSRLELAKYLWDTEGNPYFLPINKIPDINSFNIISFSDKTEDLVVLAKNNHPELQIYNNKLIGLEVERKLKFQSYLPQANLKANILSKEYYAFRNTESPYISNNYKFGFDFKMPLFLREARGNYQKTKLKITETNWAVQQKSWEIETKIRAFGNEINALSSQIKTANETLINYQKLLKNEELKFRQGESTMFVINARENKALESQIKLQTLKLKYLKSAYKQLWAAGELLK